MLSVLIAYLNGFHTERSGNEVEWKLKEGIECQKMGKNVNKEGGE